MHIGQRTSPAAWPTVSTRALNVDSFTAKVGNVPERRCELFAAISNVPNLALTFALERRERQLTGHVEEALVARPQCGPGAQPNCGEKMSIDVADAASA